MLVHVAVGTTLGGFSDDFLASREEGTGVDSGDEVFVSTTPT